MWGNLEIITLIKGFWVLLDLFMIIGAKKKIKAFLMVWIIFSIIRLIGYIYNCIKIGTSSMMLLGINIGSLFLLIISCVPVGLRFKTCDINPKVYSKQYFSSHVFRIEFFFQSFS